MGEREYLVYRHGSNASNQGACDVLPVAIVRAKSAKEACETSGPDVHDLYAAAYLARAPWVDCWNNQRFSAVAASRARRADWQEAQEATLRATALCSASCLLCGRASPKDLLAHEAVNYWCGCRVGR